MSLRSFTALYRKWWISHFQKQQQHLIWNGYSKAVYLNSIGQVIFKSKNTTANTKTENHGYPVAVTDAYAPTLVLFYSYSLCLTLPPKHISWSLLPQGGWSKYIQCVTVYKQLKQIYSAYDTVWMTGANIFSARECMTSGNWYWSFQETLAALLD